jgi:hypothetical protein
MTNFSTCSVSQLGPSFRLDSSYYQSRYMDNHRLLQGLSWPLVHLGDVAYITNGQTPREADLSLGDVLFLTAESVHDLHIDYATAKRILAKYHRGELKRTILRENDLLVTIKGKIGNAAVVLESPSEVNVNQDVARVVLRRQDLNPFYTSAFIVSKYGRLQVNQLATDQINPFLGLGNLQRIQIPVVPLAFQKQIEAMIRKAHEADVRSRDLYRQAEQRLLDELDLSDLDLPDGLHNDVPFTEAWGAHRVDAEYYQPRFEHLERAIQSASAAARPLGDLIYPIINGFDWRDFVEDGTPYIRVGDVYKDWIDLDNALRVAISPEEVKKPVGLQVGDVLFTRKGTFGQAAVVDGRTSSALISSEIMRLRLLDPLAVYPQYLSLYLNSLLGYTQVERRVHGAGFYSISQEDLAQVLICVPDRQTQEKLRDEVAKSHAAHRRSKALLDQAKHKVKALIESEAARG